MASTHVPNNDSVLDMRKPGASADESRVNRRLAMPVIRGELDMIGADYAEAARSKGSMTIDHDYLRKLWDNDDAPITPGRVTGPHLSGLMSAHTTPHRSAIGPLLMSTPDDSSRSSYFASSSPMSPSTCHLRGGSGANTSNARPRLQPTNTSSPVSARFTPSYTTLLHPQLQQQQFVSRDRSNSMPPLLLSHASEPSVMLDTPLTPPLRAYISDPLARPALISHSSLRPAADEFKPISSFVRLIPPPVEYIPDYLDRPISPLDISREAFFNAHHINDRFVLPDKARFFVMKSFGREDVLKAIKHSVWASNELGNHRLDQAFKQCQKNDTPIYLFFSVNGSGVFSGIAQLTSGLKMEDIKLWSETTRWRGHFWIRWLVIRDVPNGDLRNISCKMNDNMPVTRSRDSQELEYDCGRAVLQAFVDSRLTTTIVDQHLEWLAHSDAGRPLNASPEY